MKQYGVMAWYLILISDPILLGRESSELSEFSFFSPHIKKKTPTPPPPPREKEENKSFCTQPSQPTTLDSDRCKLGMGMGKGKKPVMAVGG